MVKTDTSDTRSPSHKEAMNSTLAYEIGAVFLLAALLMFGSVEGFVSKSFRFGPSTMVFLGVAVLGWGVYRYGWDLIRSWTPAGAATHLESSGPSAQHVELPPRPIVRRQPASRVAASDPVEILSPAAPLAAPSSAAPAPIPESADVPSPADNGPDPYESGLKRGAKRVGRFMHIIPKKQ